MEKRDSSYRVLSEFALGSGRNQSPEAYSLASGDRELENSLDSYASSTLAVSSKRVMSSKEKKLCRFATVCTITGIILFVSWLCVVTLIAVNANNTNDNIYMDLFKIDERLAELESVLKNNTSSGGV